MDGLRSTKNKMMNTKTTILMMLFILPLVLMGQNEHPQKGKDHIIKLRKDFIAEGLELSKEQEAKFWPVYDAYQLEMDSIKKKKRRAARNISEMSEQEAQNILVEDLKNREIEMRLQIQYFNDVQAIIPAKQILILNQRERLFYKKAFDRVRNRRGKRRNK